MRAMFVVILLMASTGMIYASFTAAAPMPGIDYDLTEAMIDDCPSQASPGDKLLSLVSSGGNHSIDAPEDPSVKLLEYLACRFLEK